MIDSVGIRTALQLVGAQDRVEALSAGLTTATDPSVLPLVTPWSQSADLARIVWSDVFGDMRPVNTRAAAMRVPAMARARNLLVTTISRLPLVAVKGADPLPVELQPAWAWRTDQSTSPQLRIAWTVDDLIFYGASCWVRVRNGADRFPLLFDRVPYGQWRIDDDRRVRIDGRPEALRDDEVTIIPGLHEGVLSYGIDALEDTRQLYRMVRSRLLNPVPQIDLHQTAGDPLDDDAIDALIARWAAARQGGAGGVAYTNQSIEAKEMGAGAGDQLMIEARNAAALDIARMVGVSAGRIDATTPKASLNYETTTGRNQELVDFDLALYMLPITSRLSLDDIVPRGQRVTFDLTDLIDAAPSVSGPETQD